MATQDPQYSERAERLAVRAFALALCRGAPIRRGETLEDAKEALEDAARRIGSRPTE